jgi:hypothetical protein
MGILLGGAGVGQAEIMYTDDLGMGETNPFLKAGWSEDRSNPVPGAVHEATWYLNSQKSIQSVTIQFNAGFARFVAGSQIAAPGALAMISNVESSDDPENSGDFLSLSADIQFLAPTPIGTPLEVASLNIGSPDNLNFTYEFVAEGVFSDQTTFRVSSTREAVPEPAGGLLLALGLMGCGLRRTAPTK